MILEYYDLARLSYYPFLDCRLSPVEEPGVFVGCFVALTAAGIYVNTIRRNTEESGWITRVGQCLNMNLRANIKLTAALQNFIRGYVDRISAFCRHPQSRAIMRRFRLRRSPLATADICLLIRVGRCWRITTASITYYGSVLQPRMLRRQPR